MPRGRAGRSLYYDIGRARAACGHRRRYKALRERKAVKYLIDLRP